MSYFTSAVNAADYGLSTSKTPEQNRVALQSALDTLLHVFIPKGTFNVATGLTFKSQGQKLYGAGFLWSWIRPHGGGHFITAGGRHGVRVEELRFDGQDAAGNLTMLPDSVVLAFDGAPGGGEAGAALTNARVYGVRMTNVYNGILVRNWNHIQIEDLTMDNMYGWGVCGMALLASQRVDIISINRMTYASAEAARTARLDCTSLVIDGYVHSVVLNEFRAIRPFQGIRVANSSNLPVNQRCAST